MCFRLVAVDDYSGRRCKGHQAKGRGGRRGEKREKKEEGYSDVATWFVDRLPFYPDTTRISNPTDRVLNLYFACICLQIEYEDRHVPQKPITNNNKSRDIYDRTTQPYCARYLLYIFLT